MFISSETTDTDVITTEIIKRREVGPYGIRSEYCIRKITCPLENRDAPKGKRQYFLNVKNNPNPALCEDNK